MTRVVAYVYGTYQTSSFFSIYPGNHELLRVLIDRFELHGKADTPASVPLNKEEMDLLDYVMSYADMTLDVELEDEMDTVEKVRASLMSAQ